MVETELREKTLLEAVMLLNGSIVIALVTAYAYFISYIYEIIYCGYFRIPTTLISVNSSIAIKTLMYLAFSGLVFKTYGDIPLSIVRSLWKQWDPLQPVRCLISSVIITLGISGSVWIYFRADPAAFDIAKFIAVISGVVLFAIYIGTFAWFKLVIWELKRSSDPAKLAQDIRADKNSWLVSQLGAAIGLKNAKALCAFVFFSILATVVFAVHQARAQEVFLFIESSENYAVIRMFDDKLIATQIDQFTRRSTGQMRIIPISEAKNLILKERSVGQVCLPLELKAKKADAD